MIQKLTLLLMMLAFTSTQTFAANGKESEPLPDVPPPPTSLDEEGTLEPEVRIIRKAEPVIEEYRVNGQRYMVKITPAAGRPYYLIDRDGDGQLETKRFELQADFAIPSWTIIEW